MNHSLFKGNASLTFFLLQTIRPEGADEHAAEKAWDRILGALHADELAARSLVFVRAPAAYYLGVSVHTAPDLLQRKTDGYRAGLAYLLSRHLPDAEARLLVSDEALRVAEYLSRPAGVPLRPHEAATPPCEEPSSYVQVLFARPLDPSLLYEKVLQFYGEDERQAASPMEIRLGIKRKSDPMLLEIVDHPYAAYNFRYFATSLARDENVAKTQGETTPREPSFYEQFSAVMGVPDSVLEQIAMAPNASDLLHNNDLVLMRPERVRNYILSDGRAHHVS